MVERDRERASAIDSTIGMEKLLTTVLLCFSLILSNSQSTLHEANDCS